MSLEISVLVPTHNPNAERLARTLGGLRAQTFPAGAWETVLIDNASAPAVDLAAAAGRAPANLRLVREPLLGLTHARRRGFREARAPWCVLVDDDNVLAPDYLAHVAGIFRAQPKLGAIGGRSVPEFATPPESWMQEFFPLLALRDFGDTPEVAPAVTANGTRRKEYPSRAAPIGAGMAVRREAVAAWLDTSSGAALSDRRGSELASAGDNDLVFSVLESGWQVGYFPELSLTHLIPATRLEADYLARLNRGIQESWMQVLSRHEANPWPPIPSWTVPLRMMKSWFTYRAWSSPAARIRWQGACGHFAGRRRRTPALP